MHYFNCEDGGIWLQTFWHQVDKLVHEHSSSVDSALDDDEKVTELFHKFESIKGFTARWIGKNEVPDDVVDRLSAMEDPNQTGLDRYFGQQIRRRRGRNNARRSCSEDEDSASTASNVD
uniref:Uncharacterized protein n=1 Tax=Heterosigma akashiwo TaxID=2829 RepID=A0A7S4D9J8_HETAK